MFVAHINAHSTHKHTAVICGSITASTSAIVEHRRFEDHEVRSYGFAGLAVSTFAFQNAFAGLSTWCIAEICGHDNEMHSN